jgi:hypothetical protein
VLAGAVGDLADGRGALVDGSRDLVVLTSNASRSTKTTRSIGDSVSRTNMSAIDTLSASSTSSATSGAVSSGSGNQGPTYASLRRLTVRSRSSPCRVVIRTR